MKVTSMKTFLMRQSEAQACSERSTLGGAASRLTGSKVAVVSGALHNSIYKYKHKYTYMCTYYICVSALALMKCHTYIHDIYKSVSMS